MKRPDIINSDERGKEASRTVYRVFMSRPWVTEVWETQQNGKEDAEGYDMFVRTKSSFLKVMKLGGKEKLLPVQIKSSDRRIRSFIHKYAKLSRFFNIDERYHQFVLCGMEEADLILADIVGQMVAHAAGYGISEKVVLNQLDSFGDKEAVVAYDRNKILLFFHWYGSRLPPL